MLRDCAAPQNTPRPFLFAFRVLGNFWCILSCLFLPECDFLQLRHLSEDGSEDEKRRRRQEGEGSGHLIDDKDSPKVFPKLLSPRNACRFAPLLTLARLVLSDRYASYLLILKNLRRYAVWPPVSLLQAAEWK